LQKSKEENLQKLFLFLVFYNKIRTTFALLRLRCFPKGNCSSAKARAQLNARDAKVRIRIRVLALLLVRKSWLTPAKAKVGALAGASNNNP
jgi:hypothetical protein